MTYNTQTTYVPKQTNHVLHLLLSFVTCGAWLPVWACVAVWNALTHDTVRTVAQSAPVVGPQMPYAPMSGPNPYPGLPAPQMPYSGPPAYLRGSYADKQARRPGDAPGIRPHYDDVASQPPYDSPYPPGLPQ